MQGGATRLSQETCSGEGVLDALNDPTGGPMPGKGVTGQCHYLVLMSPVHPSWVITPLRAPFATPYTLIMDP